MTVRDDDKNIMIKTLAKQLDCYLGSSVSPTHLIRQMFGSYTVGYRWSIGRKRSLESLIE